MIPIKQLLFVWVLLALAPAALQAAPEPPEEDDAFSGADPSSACPQLFGDEETRERNRRHRKELLLSVHEGKYCHVVLHSADWKDPEPVEYLGLSLLQTRLDGDSGPQALVNVSEEIEELECRPGLYLLEVDDSIGEDVRVLAILRKVVLIEDDNELKYMKSENALDPVWRMIWKSSWSMPKMPDSNKRVRHPSSHGRKRKRPSRRRRRR